ncbi:MAG: YicC family protein [Chloroflexi bacterium]|nr:YicC family protein [Chloroflexota bacterium]
MTGYGRGECTEAGFKITTELSSVNRKQSEITVNLPRELEPLEPRVRNETNRRIARGRLSIKISLHAGDDTYAGRVQLNVPLAKAYARQFGKLAKALNLSDTVTLDLLARAPGVFRTEDEIADAEAFWPAVAKSLQLGLAALLKMREREGAHLDRDLRRRVATMRKAAARIQRQAPAIVKRYQEQLRERIKNAGLGLPDATDERLLKEVVYFADRSDISEELTRLQSHFGQFDDCLKSAAPVGRTLDFLAQEMNREINTIGSKASDSAIGREVVALKAELEKFREQVQNVE